MTTDNEHVMFPAAWWLTLAQLCELLSVAPSLWESWQTAGTAPAHTTGDNGVTRVHRADLAAWLDHLRTRYGSPWLNPAEVREIARHDTRPDTTDEAPPLSTWLTVPQICAELDITPEEWQAWRTAGDAPRHVVIDGTAWLRRTDLDAWMDSLPEVDFFDAIDPESGEGR